MNTKKPNIVLLTIDSLRADFLSHHGWPDETTPFLDHLADEGLVFTNAFSASSHTREAVPAILTGEYPIQHAKDGYRLTSDDIAGSLSNESYLTGAFHSNPFLSRAFGFDKGFDEFYDDLYLGSNKILALGQRLIDRFRSRHFARGEEINKRAISWIDSLEKQRPFFLWNHYMDPHGPYTPPQAYQEKFCSRKVRGRESSKLYKKSINSPDKMTSEEKKLQEDLYCAEIKYLDDQIRDLFNELDQRGLVEESVVIITADHGDSFGENGYYGHPRKLDRELLEVPLIVFGNGNGIVEAPVSTIDIIPTILDIVNIDNSAVQGTSLLEIAQNPSFWDDRIVFSQARGEGTEESIVRYSAQSANTQQMYKIDENNPNLQSIKRTQSKVETELIEFIKKFPPSGDTELTEETSGAVQDRLEALGYKE